MVLKKSEWKVSDVSICTASSLVQEYHYSGSGSKTSVAIHGLFMACDVYNVLPYGVCWWLPLASPSAAKFFSDDWTNVLALSRMVLTPDAPKNSASFLLSRSIKMLPERYHTLATYADTWQGHTGTIYKATNWEYMGQTKPKAIYMNDGDMVSIRNGRRTKRKAEMIEAGAKLIGYFAKHRFRYVRSQPSENIQLALAI